MQPAGPRRGAELRCEHPVIEGEPQRLARVLQALHGLPGPDLLEAHLVHRLHVGADEAELVLGFRPLSASQRALAEQAFQALRAALPDTDVYVAHKG